MTDYRLLFSKKGPLIYISHLDLTHTFVRAFHRAGLTLAYSQGFNPHPKLVFALPLSVGTAGENELCDITLAEDDQSADTLLLILQENLPKQIEVKRVYPADIPFKRVVSADYTVVFRDIAEDADAVSQALSAPLIVTKKTKSGEKELNIQPQILGFAIERCEKDTTLRLTLAAASDNYLNPELVLIGLRSKHLLSTEDYSLTREKINFANVM